MKMKELVEEISQSIGGNMVSPESVRACLNHLGDIVRDETAAGREVDIAWFGSFGRSASGELVFNEGFDWTPAGNRQRDLQ